VEPTSGSIVYEGKDITKATHEEMRLLRRKMQIIFQDPYSSLNPRMTVGEILTEPLVVHGLGGGKSERLSAAKELMEKVGLKANQLNRYPHEFSGGQRQRICIARALMLRPEFVICDESVSALDVSIQAQVLNLLLDLQQEFKLTYIFISHDLGVVNFISDEVGVMNGGRLVEMGNADRIYRQPREEYTKTLLGAIPKGLPKNLESFLS
jgi:peptide/nickel transport system ATP-binding protein